MVISTKLALDFRWTADGAATRTLLALTRLLRFGCSAVSASGSSSGAASAGEVVRWFYSDVSGVFTDIDAEGWALEDIDISAVNQTSSSPCWCVEVTSEDRRSRSAKLSTLRGGGGRYIRLDVRSICLNASEVRETSHLTC